MTEWFTTRWAALDTLGRILFALMLTAFTSSTISFIIHPTLLIFTIAFTNLAVAFYSSEATYWREQALNWCAMNDLARTIAHALDHNRDVLISTDSNGNDTVVVIDKEGNHL